MVTYYFEIMDHETTRNNNMAEPAWASGTHSNRVGGVIRFKQPCNTKVGCQGVTGYNHVNATPYGNSCQAK